MKTKPPRKGHIEPPDLAGLRAARAAIDEVCRKQRFVHRLTDRQVIDLLDGAADRVRTEMNAGERARRAARR